MRWLPGFLAVALLSAAAGACGGGRVASQAAHVVPGAAATGGTPGAILPDRSTRGYLNDSDGDIGGVRANSGYRDGDDGKILAYSREAGPINARAVTAVVKRYYATAAAGDGNGACSMIVSSLVKAVPEDYGEFGPPYLRGGKTCQAVMERLFKHSHRELSAPVAVTGVLVKGDFAYALLGSINMPAGYIALRHEQGAWMIAALLGGGMP